MKGSILSLLFLLFSVPAFPQIEIAGTVKSSSGESLAGVVVKVMNGKKISGYAKSDNKGEFTIKLSGEEKDTLLLVADRLGYEQLQRELIKGTGNLHLVLRETSKTLREVTVDAPKVRQRGDTMKYRLNAFTGKSDRTLEDGLKKLPGVEVTETGTISYLGKNISDFYVENQQLVGGNYGLVTKNMPAEYVTDVEFIENHQAAAIDKGRFSDNVALNIKLSNKAKFKPVGTAEAMAGIQKNRFIYRLGGTGMLFSPKFQAMVTLKAGDYGKEQYLPVSMLSYRGFTDYAMEAIGQLTGAHPPLSRDTYAYSDDVSGTVNFLRAFSSTKTLRVNAGYNFDKTRNYYSQSSIYTTGGETIEFSEAGEPRSFSHLPYLSVNYSLNDTSVYLKNDLSAQFDFKTNDFNLVSDGRNYYQHQRVRSLMIADNFTLRKKTGTKTYSFATGISYMIAPSAFTQIISPGYMSAGQNASSHTLKWAGSTSFNRRYGNSYWNIPLNAEVSSSRLRTYLDISPVSENNVASTEAYISVSPGYEYSPRNKRVELSISVPVTLQLFHARNRMADVKADVDRIILKPSLKFVYNPNSLLSIAVNSSVNHSTGDILDLLTNEIMTDFRNFKTSSGIIGKTRDIGANVKISYKNSVRLLFGDASVAYSNIKRNTINSLYIDGEDIEQGMIFFDNTSDILSTSAMISKQFYSQGINISVRGNYSWSKNHSYQQDRLITSYSRNFTIIPRITINPYRFFELRYNASIGKSFTNFYNYKSGIFSMNNDIRLSLYPASGWDIFGEASVLRKELSDNTYKDFVIFNAGVNWKFNKYMLSLKADNLLNTRHYSYSVFNGINIYNYDFSLTGRTIYLKFSLTL